MMRKSSRNGVAARLPARCQHLERRCLLAAVTWDGGGDGTNWSDAQNWSNNVVPTSGDDVTINVPTNPTIVLVGSLAVHSLVNAETLIIRGSSAQSNGVLTLGDGGGTNNGTIKLDVASTGGYAEIGRAHV